MRKAPPPMSRLFLSVIVFSAAANSMAEVFTYEANVFPEQAGWDISQIFCDPGLSLEEDGRFVVDVDLCKGDPPPGGQGATYRRTLDEHIGSEALFFEWRLQTNADRSELPWGGGGAFAVADDFGVRYTFFIARDEAVLNRDNLLPIIHVDIEPEQFHTHRLELYGDELYIWSIDGEVVDSGIPEGFLPVFNPRTSWRTRSVWLPNTTQWDYIRYGTIPAGGSGDFNSDAVLDVDDFYFFQECRTNSGPATDAGPGCRWADMDQDSDVDAHDFALFQLAFTATE